MPCFRPITAFKPPDGGPIAFRELRNHREIEIPCGRCIGCRMDKRDAWAFRCMAEAQLHQDNAFVTLTYDDEHLPQYGSLVHRDWQLFAKRLRKRVGPFRYFMCGEYGEQFGRPHFHALVFGHGFPDRVKCNSLHASNDLFESPSLSAAWGKGRAVIGSVTFESARYCAVYATKRMSEDLWKSRGGEIVTSHGEVVTLTQPYGRMSLRPGIGSEWLRKHWPEVATHGQVFVKDRGQRIPRYFDDLLAKISPDDSEASKLRRAEFAARSVGDRTRDRLETRERCAHARQLFQRERYPNAL